MMLAAAPARTQYVLRRREATRSSRATIGGKVIRSRPAQNNWRRRNGRDRRRSNPARPLTAKDAFHPRRLVAKTKVEAPPGQGKKPEILAAAEQGGHNRSKQREPDSHARRRRLACHVHAAGEEPPHHYQDPQH